jgi:hypothetical protein
MRDAVMPGRLSKERIANLPVDVPALEDYALERALDEPLFRLLYALSTGLAPAPSRKDEGYYERRNLLGAQAGTCRSGCEHLPAAVSEGGSRRAVLVSLRDGEKWC